MRVGNEIMSGVRGASCNTHFPGGLGIHHEQLRVIEEGDGLLAALNTGEVLPLSAGSKWCQSVGFE